jgi:hypothetical protein
LGRQSGRGEKGVVEVPIGSEGAHSSAPGHRGLDTIASTLSDMGELFDPFLPHWTRRVREVESF